MKELDFDFFKALMPNTRMADYYLGCKDSSVFIDFNRSKENLIYLVRISFDGYGCCEIKGEQKHLNAIDSEAFIEEVQKSHFDQQNLKALVKKIINLNEKAIWSDALERYGLM